MATRLPHDTALIATIAVGLGIALLLGLLAVRLRLPPIVGYLAAGIVVGPFTPGFVASGGIGAPAAELGVVLLMFGVGLHFSLSDLIAVRSVVVPGALLQIFVTGGIATLLGRLWGLGAGGALVLGVSLAVASTVVMLKGLEVRDRLDSPEGRLAVGWLVVEDLAMIVVLVLLPAVAPMLGGAASGAGGTTAAALALSTALAIGKVLAFGLLMFAGGTRAVPWLLEHVARLGSRELFTLTVLSIALGVGTLASQLFGVSFALGAFVAGAVVSESELSRRAAADALPLQDAFAVLFFVSVGMLFDPRVLLEHPGQLVAVLAVIVVGKPLVSYTILRALHQSPRTALALGGGVAQIGEFSFILAALGVSLGLIGRETQALVVAGAMLSITVNQPLSWWLRRRAESAAASSSGDAAAPADPFDFGTLAGHVVLIGHGRVGGTVLDALDRAGVPCVVVEEQERIAAALRARAARAVSGDATRADVLARAGIAGARLVVVTAPEPIRARLIVEVARGLNPSIALAVRTHSATEQSFFEDLVRARGIAGRAVFAEREVALSLAQFALIAMGRSDAQSDAVVDAMR